MAATGTRVRLFLRFASRQEAEADTSLAVELAGALNAELFGRFVRDPNALAACALPFASVLDFSGTALDLGRADVETVIRKEAAACERLIRRISERARIPWSFEASDDQQGAQTVRGKRGDIIVIPRRQVHRADLWDEEVRRFLEDVPGAHFLVPAGSPRRRGPVVAAGFDEPPQERAERFASQIAAAVGAPLERHALRGEQAAARRIHGTVTGFPHARLVVVAIDGWTGAAAALARSSGAPLFLVRREADANAPEDGERTEPGEV